MIIAASAAALLFAVQTAPQTAPAADITSSLNSGPPRPAAYLAPEPAPVPVAPAPAAAPAPAPTPAPIPVAPAPVTTRLAPTTPPPATRGAV